jgi:hypothetical protein
MTVAAYLLAATLIYWRGGRLAELLFVLLPMAIAMHVLLDSLLPVDFARPVKLYRGDAPLSLTQNPPPDH